MKKSSILLLCIGLQYETIYYTDGSRSGAEYGLMGVSIFLALFYMIPALYFLFHIGKKWEFPKKVLILSLLGAICSFTSLLLFGIYNHRRKSSKV
ncbi:membrane protein, putative [Streptococcus pneumoniae]|nr:membrane protein, putative [Streptococcus pneumoniae]